MSIQAYARHFPRLLQLENPRSHVELLETIGKGNYGYVYKGKLKATQALTAVKVVFLKEDEIRETLLEMEILEKCHHPNITQFMGGYLKGLDLWICMELCNAGALDFFLRCLKKPFTEDVISALLFETIKGLDYLHSEIGLIHRDIKAGNLFLNRQGQVKIGDFGVSAQLDSPSGTAKTFIGTPYWMAPEVILTDPENAKSQPVAYTSKADIWSIGITAIEIAEKLPPLSDIHPMRALALIPITEMNLRRPKNWSRLFQDLIKSCLHRDPVKRPSAKELLDHPFITKAKFLDTESLIAELIQKAFIAKERKNAGLDEDEDVPKSVVKETLKFLKAAPPPKPPVTIPAPVASPFPTVSNSPIKFDEISGKTCLDAQRVSMLFGTDLNTATFLDQEYILLGMNSGLYFVIKSKPLEGQTPIPLIRNTRFKKVEVVPEYGVMLALSGKHDHVRQYSLTSIRKLIQYVLGKSISDIIGPQTVDEDYKHVFDMSRKNDQQFLEEWTNDYVKIAETKESESFNVQKTETSVFMSVLFKKDVILYEWAKAPYLKFMKLKAFWLPERPKFVQLFHDGLEVHDVLLAYQSEANLIRVDNSQVEEVHVSNDFLLRTGRDNKARWRSFHQIPFSEEKKKEIRTASERSSIVSRKVMAATRLTLPRNTVEQYFLATYHRASWVVDMAGNPLLTSGAGGWKDGFMWADPPNAIILRHLNYVIATTDYSIDIVDWRSAKLLQRLKMGTETTVRILNEEKGQLLILLEHKKRKESNIYWLKEPLLEVNPVASWSPMDVGTPSIPSTPTNGTI